MIKPTEKKNKLENYRYNKTNYSWIKKSFNFFSNLHFFMIIDYVAVKTNLCNEYSTRYQRLCRILDQQMKEGRNINKLLF